MRGHGPRGIDVGAQRGQAAARRAAGHSGNPELKARLISAVATEDEGKALASLIRARKLDGQNGALLGQQLLRLVGPPGSMPFHRVPESLFGQTLLDLADPAAIRSGGRFCAPVLAASALARQEPVDYARMVADLATTGVTVPRGPGSKGGMHVHRRLDEVTGLSATQRLLAPALAQEVNPHRVSPNGTTMPHAPGHTGRPIAGVGAPLQEAMLELVTGRPYDSFSPNGGQYSVDPLSQAVLDARRRTATDLVAARVSKGEHVALEVRGHWYEAVRLEGDTLTMSDHLGQGDVQIDLGAQFPKVNAIVYEGGSFGHAKAGVYDWPGGGDNGQTSVDTRYRR